MIQFNSNVLSYGRLGTNLSLETVFKSKQEQFRQVNALDTSDQEQLKDDKISGSRHFWSCS